MSKIITLITFLLLFIRCKNDHQKFADQQYEEFKKEITSDSFNGAAVMSAENVVEFHYDSVKKEEAQKWLIIYKKRMDAYHFDEKKKSDSLEQKVNALGGYKLIEIDKKAKCNLSRGYFRLNKEIKDSAELSFLAKYLADSLFQSTPTKQNCPNLVMSQAFIYQPKIDDLSKWASLCTISPLDHYQGEVTVNKNPFIKMN